MKDGAIGATDADTTVWQLLRRARNSVDNNMCGEVSEQQEFPLFSTFLSKLHIRKTTIIRIAITHLNPPLSIFLPQFVPHPP